MVRALPVICLTVLAIGCSRQSHESSTKLSPIDNYLALTPADTRSDAPIANSDSSADKSGQQEQFHSMEASLKANYRNTIQDSAELEKLLSPSLRESLGPEGLNADFLKHIDLVPGSLAVDSSGRAEAKLQFQSSGRLYLVFDGTRLRASHFSFGSADSMDPLINVPDSALGVEKLLGMLRSDPMKLRELHVVSQDGTQQPLWQFSGIIWSEDSTPRSDTKQLTVLCNETREKFQVDLSLTEYLCSIAFQLTIEDGDVQICNISILK